MKRQDLSNFVDIGGFLSVVQNPTQHQQTQDMGVFVFFKKTGKTIPYYRGGSTDIVYVGCVKKRKLHKRLHDFDLWRTEDTQTGNVRYKIEGKFNANDVHVAILKDSDPVAKKKEILKTFKSIHGSYPPLNKKC